MPRRIELTVDVFNGYTVNSSKENPLYEATLRRVIDVIEASSSGRWELVHTVIWPYNEAKSISAILKKLSSHFSPGCFRYVWSKENHMNDRSAIPDHYHLAVFYHAQEHSFSTLSGALTSIQANKLIRNYQLVKPNKARISHQGLLSALEHAKTPTHALDLRDPLHVRWAVFWCSYLAKTHTKERISGRTFGSSALHHLQ